MAESDAALAKLNSSTLGASMPVVTLPNGQKVATGTVGSLLVNIVKYNELVASGATSATENVAELEAGFSAAVPMLVRVGLFDLFSPAEWQATGRNANPGRWKVGQLASDYIRAQQGELGSTPSEDTSNAASATSPIRADLMPIVDACDNWPLDGRGHARFVIDGQAIGWLNKDVTEAVTSRFPDSFSLEQSQDHMDAIVRFSVGKDDGAAEISARMNAVARELRDAALFDVLDGWRSEQYSIYGLGGRLLFTLERAACALFGVVTYGAHLNVYIPATRNSPLRIWCPRRSKTKATYPGMLDNSVAGGIANGLSAYETIVKEAWEEASIPEDIARRLIRPVGAISYVHEADDERDGTHKAPYIQPEVQYLFDMAVEGDLARTLVLKPNDGEAEDFELLTVDQLTREMVNGGFKPNCAAVLLDFFVRHSILTQDHKDFVQIQQRLHRTFDFPTL